MEWVFQYLILKINISVTPIPIIMMALNEYLKFQEWVCDNQDYVPQLYTYGVVGSILGTIVFRLLTNY
jgi:hypothetical protein